MGEGYLQRAVLDIQIRSVSLEDFSRQRKKDDQKDPVMGKEEAERVLRFPGISRI